MVFNGYIRIDHWNNKLFFCWQFGTYQWQGYILLCSWPGLQYLFSLRQRWGGGIDWFGVWKFADVVSKGLRWWRVWTKSLARLEEPRACLGWATHSTALCPQSWHSRHSMDEWTTWMETGEMQYMDGKKQTALGTTVVMLETIYRWLVREKVATMARSAIVGITTSSVWCSESGPLGYGSRDFNPDKVEDWLVQTLNHSFLVGGLDFFHFSIYWE